jgi:hypothetical protein
MHTVDWISSDCGQVFTRAAPLTLVFRSGVGVLALYFAIDRGELTAAQD